MTLSHISLPWLTASATVDVSPAVWALWGAVAVFYLLLFLVPPFLSSHEKKAAGAVTRPLLLAALLLLHVGGIYALLAEKVPLSWVLAVLLSSAVVGISLGNLQGVLFPARPDGAPSDASVPTETEAEAEANAPDGDGDAPDAPESEVPLGEAPSAAEDGAAEAANTADAAPAPTSGRDNPADESRADGAEKGGTDR